ncbi:UNC93-like protein 2 [Fusarium oxysporum f. sp. rapae]|uniref:UNC93-like protein 2 n=1 Tax=Fusarium oxysporum f. sp. rapae TaxID=485398 RepID=A0A8J5NUC9_FUSOX|nr:UNC93-like protein 2 [Fusarium oxysporum f. sp. rapae]
MATAAPKDDHKNMGQNDLAPTTSYIDGEVLDAGIDYGYLNAPKFTKFYRSVLFQMILLGLLSCVGPAMSDAISNLGGGGLSTPYLANLATSLNYTAGCLLTLFGGPLINKFGVWSAMRNSGSVIGGAINLSKNHSDSKAGGVAWSTYLVFIAFECTGLIWAFLLSPTRRVRRRDSSKVPISERASWKHEFTALWRHLQRRKTWLMALPAFYSFFCGGTMGTYLSLHFSVRARALSSLLLPTLSIVMVMAYGKVLDRTRWSQAKRAWISLACWLIPQAACFIWIGIEYAKFGGGKLENALDYKTNTRRWAEAYLPYLILQSTSYVCQLSLYWILGTFSTDAGSSARSGGLLRAFETAGQTVSYAINSHSGSDARIPFYVHAVILCLTVPCMVFLIRLVPEAPATTDIDVEPVIEGLPHNKQVT